MSHGARWALRNGSGAYGMTRPALKGKWKVFGFESRIGTMNSIRVLNHLSGWQEGEEVKPRRGGPFID